MTLPTAVKNYLIKQYGSSCFNKTGLLAMKRKGLMKNIRVVIQDVMLDIHGVTYYIMQSRAKQRRYFIEKYDLSNDIFRDAGYNLDDETPNWVDVLLFLLRNANNFYFEKEESDDYEQQFSTTTATNSSTTKQQETQPEDKTKTFIMLFDRGTPPAKYLKHKERYDQKESALPSELLITNKEQLQEIFNSKELPIQFDSYMKQKMFVDGLIKKIAKMIIDFYHPPKDQNFILDGPGETRLIFKNGVKTTLKDPSLLNRCLEADLSVIFWCHNFAHKNIKVITTDGDVLLSLLIYSKYRINGVRESKQRIPGLYDYRFSNQIYLQQNSESIPENTDSSVLITKLYEDLVLKVENNPNELFFSKSEKETFINHFKARLEMQNICEDGRQPTMPEVSFTTKGTIKPHVNNNSPPSPNQRAPNTKRAKKTTISKKKNINNDDDGFDLDANTIDFSKVDRSASATAALPPIFRRLVESSNNTPYSKKFESSSKLKINKNKRAFNDDNDDDDTIEDIEEIDDDDNNNNNMQKKTQEQLFEIDFDNCEELLSQMPEKCNEALTLTCDISYAEGKKIFKRFEIVDINRFYQAVTDDLMARFDSKKRPGDAAFFKPIESLFLACKLCGDDYVKKLGKIGETFILDSFFKNLNENGLLVFARTIDITQHTKHSLEKPKFIPRSIAANSQTSQPLKKYSDNDDSDYNIGDDDDSEKTIEDAEMQKNSGDNNDNNDMKSLAEKSLLEIKKKKKTEEELMLENDLKLVTDLENEYKQYERLYIDYDAINVLFSNAFRLKKAKTISFEQDQVDQVCSNASYTINYFSNDYKPGVYTDCFEKHIGFGGCGKSIYGFMIPDDRERPSRNNIGRTNDVCKCHTDTIGKIYRVAIIKKK